MGIRQRWRGWLNPRTRGCGGTNGAQENVYPRKERPENKIDGAVALIMALGRHMVAEERPTWTTFSGIR